MPQTDLLSFPSTIFFLLLTFLGGYLLFISFILPDLLFISKARQFLSHLTLTTSQTSIEKKVSTLLNNSKSLEANFTNNLGKLASIGFISDINIFMSLEDVLLAVNFLNLVFVLYYVLRESLYKQQLDASKTLIKPLVDLQDSTHKITSASQFYEVLSLNLRNEVSKPLLVQANLWNKYRNVLFFRPIAATLSDITLYLLNEQKNLVNFVKNKNLLKQVQNLKQNLSL